jgi:putative pyruvate formate lyase activating enzyme
MKYGALYQSGELLQRVRAAYRRLAACDLCPHVCGVNRIKGERGVCGVGLKPKIASANVHHGEEPPISGVRGSGTIFLSGCSLKCVFCQNFPISHLNNGNEITTAGLAAGMLKLQKQGVHNINFVTPTHFLPQILAALYLAIPSGFNLPILWNCSGYERVDALQLLDGIVSIYLPDMKYADDCAARVLSSAPDYRAANQAAVREMQRQVGNLVVGEHGLAVSGLIIRHLVLPNGLSGTKQVMGWISDNLGAATHISLMSQYFPAYQAVGEGALGKKISQTEYDEAIAALEGAGLENGWIQDFEEEQVA